MNHDFKTEILESAELMDAMTSIQNWAMQSPNWKLLNVLFELFSAEQLQKSDDESAIFDDMCDILKMALVRPFEGPIYLKDEKSLKSAMSNVRDYIMNTFIPQFVNKTLEVGMTPKRSLRFLELIDQASKIEDHFKDYKQVKIDHLARIQILHEQLLDAGAIVFSEEFLPEYERIYAGIVDTWSNIKEEKHKTRGMRIIKRHLLEFDK